MELIKTYPSFLKREVSYFYTLRASLCEMEDSIHRHLPDGTLELIFNLAAPILQSADGLHWFRSPDIMVTGLFKQRNIIKYTGQVHIVGAVFRPGYASLFVHDNLQHFSECVYSAEMVFKSSVFDIADMIANTSPEKIKHRILENFLLKHLATTRSANTHQISHAVDLIKASRGDISIAFLKHQVCMSERNFRRRFDELVGISPKHFSAIIRVKSIVKEHKKTFQLLNNLIYSHGYTDSAHFTNDFKKIAGQAPTIYLMSMNPVDGLFINEQQNSPTD